MKIRTRYTRDSLLVYRETIGVMLFTLFLAAAFMGLGYSFTIIPVEVNTEWIALGSFFMTTGFALLLYLPFYFYKIWKKGGAVLLEVNSQGLLVSPELNVKPVHYGWDDIDRIVITNRFILKDSEGKSFAKPMAVIFLKQHVLRNINLVDRAIKRLWESPKGQNVYYIDLPADEVTRLHAELTGLAPAGSEIRDYQEVFFNTLDSTENYTP